MAVSRQHGQRGIRLLCAGPIDNDLPGLTGLAGGERKAQARYGQRYQGAARRQPGQGACSCGRRRQKQCRCGRWRYRRGTNSLRVGRQRAGGIARRSTGSCGRGQRRCRCRRRRQCRGGKRKRLPCRRPCNIGHSGAPGSGRARQASDAIAGAIDFIIGEGVHPEASQRDANGQEEAGFGHTRYGKVT